MKRHHESNHLGLDVITSDSLVSGVSTGLFSAAALSTAHNLADMVQTGAETLRVAFRLGVYIQDFSGKLESAPSDGSSQSWAHVVTGMSKKIVGEEISKYNAQTGVSDLSKVFISSVDKTFVSVAGPPSRLRAAFEYSQSLRYSNSFPLPIYGGLYQASHVYTVADVTAIVANSSDDFLASRNVSIPLTFSQHGTPFVCTKASDLLRSICNELLTGETHLDDVTAAIVQHVVDKDLSSCAFDTFRTSLATKSVIDGINSTSPQDVLMEVFDLVSWAFEDYGHRQPASTSDAKLAIIGMACRMPGGANDPEQFWERLDAGYDACIRALPDRVDLETRFGRTREIKETAQIEYGNFIDRPGMSDAAAVRRSTALTLCEGYFDAGFFAMSPEEAEQTDPLARLALVAGYEAMEMAGIVPGRTMSTKSSRIGTYFDRGSQNWRDSRASQIFGTEPGGARSFTTAVHVGCAALWAGDVDTVIAGGANVIADLDNHAGFCNAPLLSKTGQCKVWDKDADGYCPAEGVGAVVIKRLEDAEEDNDNILAVVLSVATNQSADARPYTRAHAAAQEANYRQGM